MKISITIMAHPKRRKQANILLAKLANYPFVHGYITWDEKNDEWHTGERALRKGVDLAADWHIVLQDDAIIPDDFYNHVENALNACPDRSLVSFYTGTVKPLPQRIKDAVDKATYCSWIRGNMLYWGVGIAIPTFHILPMLEFVDGRQELYDVRIGYFYQRNRLPVWYTNPSLVNHDDDLASLLAHDGTAAPRVAHRFIDGPVRWNNKYIDIR